jgi:hypothetical protein
MNYFKTKKGKIVGVSYTKSSDIVGNPYEFVKEDK